MRFKNKRNISIKKNYNKNQYIKNKKRLSMRMILFIIHLRKMITFKNYNE